MSDLENKMSEEEDFEDLLKLLDSLDDEDTNMDALLDILGISSDEMNREFESQSIKLDLKFKKSNEDAVTPSYAYPSDSGFDLYSTEEVTIDSLDRKLIPTGIHINIPDGYEIQVRSKSGLALKEGLMVLNSPGTVDQGYTGEIQVIIFNTSNQSKKINKGQKVAQAVLCPVVSGKWINFVEQKEIDNKDRNESGFGSTGI